MRPWLCLLAIPLLSAEPIPVRGLHVGAPKPDEIELAVRFMREALPKEGVNTLFVELNYRYQYQRHPELVDADALSRDDVTKLVAAARESGVKLVPMINLLGHQSWAKTTFGLLRAHPEFDETPGLYPDNDGIYCRSYCPLHPDLHNVVFDLIDELMDVTGASDFHAGMDEVFLLGEDTCPRCKGKNKAELFANEVRAVHDHLAEKNRTLWIWGDRFIDGATTGIGKWEAAMNGTHTGLSLVPKDVIIDDWHYEAAHPTPPYFALQGFRVVASPWRKSGVALRQLDLVRATRRDASLAVADRMLGVVQTTWVSFGQFANAYFGDKNAPTQVVEVVNCFKELFRDLRRVP